MRHSFDTNLANEFGLEKAIILDFFIHWLYYNSLNSKNIINGKVWVFAKGEKIADEFPYLRSKGKNKTHKIYNIIKDLIKEKVLIKDCFCSNKFERTAWYSLSDEYYYLLNEFKGVSTKLQNCNLEVTKLSDEKLQNCNLIKIDKIHKKIQNSKFIKFNVAPHAQNSQEFKNSDLNNLDYKKNFNSINENLDLAQDKNSFINEQKQPLKTKTEPKEYKDTTEQEKTLKMQRNTKFEKPSLDEVKKYAYIAGLKVDCERFYDYYESNGWLIGNKAKMRDWKASLRNWARNDNKFGNNQNANKSLTQRLNEQEARILAKYETRNNLIDCEILGD